MSDDSNKNVMDFLREQFARVHVRFDKIDVELCEIKHRLTAVEIQVGSLSETKASHYGAVMLRLDRIQRWLDLIDEPAS